MSVTLDRMAMVFNEWARRYNENPEQFDMDMITRVDKSGKPVKDYGMICAVYFCELAKEMDSKNMLPRPVL